jgi:hypothetical protein
MPEVRPKTLRSFRPSDYGCDNRFCTITTFYSPWCYSALGQIDSAIDLATLGPLLLGPIDKSLFSMLVPDVETVLSARPHIKSIVIFGIEVCSSSIFSLICHVNLYFFLLFFLNPGLVCAIYNITTFFVYRRLADSSPLHVAQTHVCVMQTVLSILSSGVHAPYVVADGVSSCNSFEIPIALDRMRTEGARIGTSESIAFQLMADASLPAFKAFSRFIKDEKDSTRRVGEALLQGAAAEEERGKDVVVVSKY